MGTGTRASLIGGDPEQWDLVIEPKRSLLDLRLGKSWRACDRIMVIMHQGFVSVYKQTVLGPLWYVIQLLLATITFTVFFRKIANLVASHWTVIMYAWLSMLLIPFVIAALHVDPGLGFLAGLCRFWNRCGNKKGKTPRFLSA